MLTLASTNNWGKGRIANATPIVVVSSHIIKEAATRRTRPTKTNILLCIRLYCFPIDEHYSYLIDE